MMTARLEATLRSLQDSYARRSEFWFRSVDPYLRTRIDYDAWSDRRSAAGVDWVAILEDREFRNLIVHGEWFTEGDTAELEDALEQLNAVLDLLHEGRTN